MSARATVLGELRAVIHIIFDTRCTRLARRIVWVKAKRNLSFGVQSNYFYSMSDAPESFPNGLPTTCPGKSTACCSALPITP
eukprot:6665164-Pyramimonas_sp.AAC.1